MFRSRPERVALLMLCVVGLGALAGSASAAPPTGVQLVDAAWTKAMKANDVEAVSKLYARDAIAWFPNDAAAKGDAAIKALYVDMLGKNTVKDASLSNARYETIGTRSVGWGTFSLTLQPKSGGAPVTMTGRYTVIGEKRNGAWVYVVDHASADPAPGPGK